MGEGLGFFSPPPLKLTTPESRQMVNRAFMISELNFLLFQNEELRQE